MIRFEPSEKLLMAEICTQHPILLDTHYNGSVLRQKKETWEKIVSQFNATNAEKPPYDVAQLRGLWKRLKDDAKQDTDKQKKFSEKTGGGPNSFAFRNRAVELIANFIGSSYDPLDNPCDDDVFPFQEGPSDPLPCHSQVDAVERRVERSEGVDTIVETPNRSKPKKRKQVVFDDRLLDMAEEEHAKKMAILEREEESTKRKKETARRKEETAKLKQERERVKLLLAKAKLAKAGINLH